MQDPLDGKAIRAIRTSLGMTETEFALLFGVTIRTVELWETDVVVPSRITAMVIRAESERARTRAGLGERGPARPTRTRRPRQASGRSRNLA